MAQSIAKAQSAFTGSVGAAASVLKLKALGSESAEATKIGGTTCPSKPLIALIVAVRAMGATAQYALATTANRLVNVHVYRQ